MEELLKEMQAYKQELSLFVTVNTVQVMDVISQWEKKLNDLATWEMEKSELNKAREEYFKKFKKKPFGAWNLAEIRAKIDA